MEGSALSSFIPHLKRFAPVIVLGLLGVIFIGYGIVSSNTSDTNDDIVFEQAAPEQKVTPTKANLMVIDLQGAVKTPGVYQLPEGARVKELIEQAGGFSETVNTEWIAKKLNLASKVTDGMKLYIPFHDEEGVAGVMTGEAAEQNSISINSSSATALESLPGVGPVTAEKIIDNRPYNSFEKIKNKITL
jgi:competence protein ComEA